MTTTYTGQSMRRMEDDRLLRGAGQFVADLAIPGMLHMVVVRSTEAHAIIDAIDASEALATEGVVSVVTSADLPGTLEVMVRPGVDATLGAEHPLLAGDRALYVGQPVALVIAESLAIAEDAAELVDVRYTPLPAVTDARASAGATTPLHPGLASNVVLRTPVLAGDPEAAFANADHIVSGSFIVPRVAPSPMEGRGCVATYDDAEQRMQVWTSTQASHEIRAQLMYVFGENAPELHVVSLDVGGGFGQKHHLYPDEAAVVVMAHRLGRPVRWIESRRENLIASHSRGFVGEVDAAVRNDGRILGMRARVFADLGAVQIHGSFLSPDIAAKRMTGPYDIESLDMQMLGVVTNKPPTGPYRGAGQPEASIMMERVVDRIAADLGLDPVEVRRKNLIQPEQFPYTTAGGITIDSGNYQAAFEHALEVADYRHWRADQASSRVRDNGKLLGIGVAATASGSGGSGGVGARSSYSRITLAADGNVTIDTDVSPHGQGMGTSFAQLVADQLGVVPDDITLRSGDTDNSTPYGPGTGTYASRSLVIGGSAAHEAAKETRTLLEAVAAQALECEPTTVRIEQGRAFSTSNRARTMTVGELASLAQRDREPTDSGTLEVEHIFTLPSSAFSFAAHVAVVEVEPKTGEIEFKRFIAAHDCGVAVNPLIVHGQIAGGIAQGLGEALVEVVEHDSNGAPSATSFMDYGMFQAADMPHVTPELLATPTSLTPTGMRGVGEAPSVASPVALANAVMDALAPLGVTHIDLPLTPERVWAAIRDAQS
jgi:aerobic carbon-monoxide dehydrogenase large subunit